ncbi:NACHT domain protein [Fusarium austroafricanum]|uniref:NACHT domain protein n=1 Tax=Fusarium austroafricanum TaxID=2364996 RepID=A0A8H4NFS1_9HYPO|nr:NACHT domain protein [Fusarium austroafricanum]
MTSTDPAQTAFNKAIREFKTGLKDQALYTDILATTSIDQVYDLTDQLQKVQGRGDHLRNLARIGVYLERMRAYTGVIDTFVQVKPDILALIWGPIRLLIQWTSNLTKSLDALIGMIEEMGILLPEFDLAAKLFGNKQHVNQVLALLFQDMLDFYLVSLKFFRMERLGSFFEALWPRKKEEIDAVIERMKEHTEYLRNEVRLQDIEEAYEARQSDIESFVKLEESSRRQEYNGLETAIKPVFYNKKLNFLLSQVCVGTGDWFINHEVMAKWLRITNDSQKVIWLCGIPGAGKTYLSACAIEASKAAGITLFVFLSHEQHDASALSVMHSLIFQISRNDQRLQDIMCHSSRDSIEYDLSATVKLFINLARGAGHVRIVIDGLDEIGELERANLLRRMLMVSTECPETRIMIASRPEGDIKALLEKKSKSIRVDTNNTDSIYAFAMTRCEEWLKDRCFSEKDSKEIKSHIGILARQAKGMFLYAHLVLRGIDLLHTVSEIKQDLVVPPTDLNAAYERIFSRINKKLPNQAARMKARKALGWIGCSPVPLTIRELEQALVVNIGDMDQDLRGISSLDLDRLCGPVVEEIDGELHLCTLRLAKCCITYLCQSHHDDLDDDLFERNVIDGVYRLHHFASSNWSHLVMLYLKERAEEPTADDETDLIQLLNLIRLLTQRGNVDFLPSEARGNDPVLKTLLTEESKDEYELVCNEVTFHKEASSRLLELGQGALDPLLNMF